MARDFIHCDGLEDVLVSFVTAVAQESFIANGLKKLQWQMFYAYMYGTTQQDMEQNIVGKLSYMDSTTHQDMEQNIVGKC